MLLLYRSAVPGGDIWYDVTRHETGVSESASFLYTSVRDDETFSLNTLNTNPVSVQKCVSMLSWYSSCCPSVSPPTPSLLPRVPGENLSRQTDSSGGDIWLKRREKKVQNIRKMKISDFFSYIFAQSAYSWMLNRFILLQIVPPASAMRLGSQHSVHLEEGNK